jgi:hypothetical protein
MSVMVNVIQDATGPQGYVSFVQLDIGEISATIAALLTVQILAIKAMVIVMHVDRVCGEWNVISFVTVVSAREELAYVRNVLLDIGVLIVLTNATPLVMNATSITGNAEIAKLD